MLSLILIFLIVLINLFILVILNRKNIIFNLPNWINIVAISIFVIGLTLIIWQNWNIDQEMSKRNWKSTDGIIIESEIVGNRAYRARVKYRYAIEDSVFKGSSDYNIPGFGGRNYRKKTARIVKNQNPVGSKVVVFYDPSNYKNSVLRFGPYYSNYLIFAFGTILVGFGVFIILNNIFRGINKEKS